MIAYARGIVTLSDAVIIGLILAAGGAVQSTAGFGFGMFAIPLLIRLGTPPPEAITIVAVCAVGQALIGVYQLRSHVNWRQVVILTLLAVTTLPLGVWLLDLVVQLERRHVRQVFGLVVLIALVAQWLWRVKPRASLHWGWCVGAMTTCGVMAGMSGMGGPPAVMWVMSHRWSNQRSRATLWSLFASLTPLQLFLLHHQFGTDVLRGLGTGAMLAPVTLLGIIPGLWLGHRMSKDHLRRLSQAILLLVALDALLSPLLGAAWPRG